MSCTRHLLTCRLGGTFRLRLKSCRFLLGFSLHGYKEDRNPREVEPDMCVMNKADDVALKLTEPHRPEEI